MLLGLSPLLCEQQAPQETLSTEMQQVAAAQDSVLRSNDGQQILTASEADASQALALLGDLEVFEAQLPRACSSYEEALELVDHDPGSTFDQALPTCVSLSRTRADARRDWMLEAREYRRLDEPEKAAVALEHAWRLHDGVSVGLTAVAAFASAGQRKEAETLGEQILKKDSNTGDAQAYSMLAAAFHNGGDLNGTIVELQRALALDPASASTHFALGNAFWELNEQQFNPDTLREFTEAQRLNPNDFESDFSLGLLLSQCRRYSDAERFLRAAADLNASSPDPWLQLGLNDFAQGEMQAAAPALQRAVQLTGSDEARDNYAIQRAYAALSRIAIEGGQREQADEFAKHAEALHERVALSRAPAAVSQSMAPDQISSKPPGLPSPNPPAATAASGPSVPPAAEWPSLEKDLQALIAECLNDAGTALAQQHAYAEALPFFREAAVADPEHIPVERNLGLAAVHTGHYDEAIQALSKALEQMPGDALTQKYLEQAREHR